MINSRLIIFHYHLLPGGVTSVISGGVEAVVKYVPEIREIVLAAGRSDNADAVVSKLQKTANESGNDVKIFFRHIPETDYLENRPNRPADLNPTGRALARRLLKEFEGYVWWIHNYHIGKNPILTRALIDAAYMKPKQQLILQIHDFPESGRFQNLRNLEGVSPLYPEGANIRYLTINDRDRKILIKAGLPEKRVILMPNPVKGVHSFTPMPPDKKAETRNMMAELWGSEFPAYDPEALAAFYPVRTIRRKNILEAGLLTILAPLKTNLIVTLPGISAQEKAYSQLVSSLFRMGVIPGIWGTGLSGGTGVQSAGRKASEIPGFWDIASSCDFVISASLQEGFGYLFTEAAGWGKRLFSRKMDILEEIIPLLDEKRCGTYSELNVPMYGRMKERTQKAYRTHLADIAGFLPDEILGNLREKIAGFTGSDHIDFSRLPINLQAEVLEKAATDSGYREKCIKLNTGPLHTMETIITAGGLSPTTEETEGIEARYGLKAFGEGIKAVFESLSAEPQPGISPGDIKPSDSGSHNGHKRAKKKDPGTEVLKSFNTPDYHRLIFQPFSG